MYNWDAMTDDDLRKEIMEELNRELPDKERYFLLMSELERRHPVRAIPVELVALWAKTHPRNPPSKPKWKQALKGVVAAVLVFALLGIVPSAFGAPNVFETVGKWTKDIFSFSEKQSVETGFQTKHPGLQELYAAVTELGVTEKVVPTWLPEGYTLEKIDKQSSPTGITVYAIFDNVGQEIQINIRICNGNSMGDYQIDNEIVETCDVNGVKTYYVSNMERYCAMWQKGNVECSIYADTLDELKQIVESVY